VNVRASWSSATQLPRVRQAAAELFSIPIPETTGQVLAQWLERRIWQKLGIQCDGSFAG
jgi:hypothetical protein